MLKTLSPLFTNLVDKQMKTAVLLASMGGPDSLQAVRPFLVNLFNDPSILRVPSFIRPFLAQMIASGRDRTAQAVYKKMGGCSPLLANTQKQAKALESVLKQEGEYCCFVGMSYWHPFLKDTMKEVKSYGPDRIIVVPLYPQFSTTTTLSVIRDVKNAAHELGLICDIVFIENFYRSSGFIQALAESTKEIWNKAICFGSPLVLFSAHGLPEKIVRGGDPYPAQCMETASLLAHKINLNPDQWKLCYQSRIGPLKWIGPSINQLIDEAAHQKRPIVVVPIAFVCEHSETLVELGIEYKERAMRNGAPFYGVAATVGIKDAFIQGLAARIRGINQ